MTIDRDKARQMLSDMQRMGKNPPTRQWAYDLVNRWDSGDRKHITPWPLQLAREACKADQFGRIEEMSDG